MHTGVIEVTEAVEFAIVEDRLHFILTSGERRLCFSISRHKARNAAHEAIILLDRDAERVQVSPFCNPCFRGLDDKHV